MSSVQIFAKQAPKSMHAAQLIIWMKAVAVAAGRLYCHIIACLPNKRMLCNAIRAIRRREVLSPGKATSDACGKRPRTLHMLICVADMHLMCGRPTACADGHQHVPSCHQLAYCCAPPVAMRCCMSKPKPKLTAENLRRMTSLRCPDSVRTQHRQIRRQ